MGSLRLVAASTVLVILVWLSIFRSTADVQKSASQTWSLWGTSACEKCGAITVGEPWASLLLGGESNACIARSFDGAYSFFTFDPSVDVYVSKSMLENAGLYDHMVHTALEDTLARAKASENAHDPVVVVDAGANLGTLTLFASSRGCTVISFELQSRVVHMLEASIYVNRFRNTVVRTMAVSEVAGQIVTYKDVPDNPGGVGLVVGSDASTSTRTVKTVTLDGEFPSPARIQFLKIDTEGHELPILRGAKSLFAEHRVDSVVLELRAHQAKEAAEFLYSNGYMPGSLFLCAHTM